MRAMMAGALLLVLAGALCLPAFAAEETGQSRTEMFEAAREAAWAGQREYAVELCLRILDRHPNDHDTRILLGRIHAWEKRFPEARRELGTVITAKPLYLDARLALIDTELWDNQAEEAIRLCDEGLENDPNEADLLYRKFRALRKLGREQDALEVARLALAANPDDRKLYRTVKRLEADAMKNKLAVWYRYEHFDQALDPWHESGVQVSHKFPWGTLIGRGTQAWRFGDTGTQFEVDAYPKLPNRFYMYLNAGASGSRLFPDYRYGAELYKNFGGGWEASAGAFRLHFDSTTAKLYTGSLGKYWRNYWFSLRPTLSIRDPDNSLSWRFSTRRYFGDREDYVGFSVGTGTRPEQDFLTGTENDLNSGRLQVEAQKRVIGRWIAKASAGVREQEFLTPDTRDSWFVRVGMEWWF